MSRSTSRHRVPLVWLPQLSRFTHILGPVGTRRRGQSARRRPKRSARHVPGLNGVSSMLIAINATMASVGTDSGFLQVVYKKLV